jgi:4-diphosphocytidyl-2-C-methyl-D-erythritol kinase
MLVKARAKLNLYLHVNGKRPDNYHNVESLMVFTDELYDEMEIVAGNDMHITVAGALSNELSSQPNIITKIIEYLQQLSLSPFPVHIRLDKYIPICAGMGGGSADAALALKLLAEMWQVPITTSRLSEIASIIGADIPVCYHGAAAYVSGIGEQVAAVQLPPLWAVVLNPRQQLSTASLFAEIVEKGYTAPLLSQPQSFEDISVLIEFLKLQHNDFTLLSGKRMPVIHEMLAALRNQPNCLLARMTGTGPSCFGLFAQRIQAEVAAREISRGCPGWFVKSSRL